MPDLLRDTTSQPSPDTSFEAQYKRVFAAAECRTQAQLAAVLGVKQSSVSDAKRRKSVPSEWLMKLFEKMRINPEWIRTGAGLMRFSTGEANESLPYVVKITEVRPPAECSSQELFTELVRRAMVPFDFEEIQKQAMTTWMPKRQGGNER